MLWTLPYSSVMYYYYVIFITPHLFHDNSNREFIDRFRRLKAPLQLKEKQATRSYPHTNEWYMNKQTKHTKIKKHIYCKAW